jgi:hypothetical protein
MAKSSSAKARAVPVKGARPLPPPPAKKGVPLWVGLVLAAFLLIVGVTVLLGTRTSKPAADASILRLTAAEQRARLTATGGTVDEQTDPGSSHVQAPTYKVNPPAGGDHLSAAASPKVYTAEAVPPDGTVVHAMEHGYIVLWYRPDLRGDDLATLKAVVDTYPRDVLLVPRASLPTATPVVATAWHHRLLLPTVVKAPLLDFTALYRNKGPEAVPH